MQTTTHLKDIASVSSGVTFRSKIENTPTGNALIIQMKDLGTDNTVQAKNAIRSHLPKIRENQTLNKSDIIFRSRGQTNTAVLLREDIGVAVLAAPLLRIRPDKTKVLPEYLFWWLNQPNTQAYFTTQAKGTQVQMIGKAELDALSVSLPSLEIQKQIADIVMLSMREHDLLEQIKNAKIRYTHGLITKLIETGANNV